MKLKRGSQRGSCDFCFRRKIKCDRTIRASQGYASCSHCDLRQVPCQLDDSDDVRIQKRKRSRETGSTETQEAIADSSLAQHGDDSVTTPSPFIHPAASLVGPATTESTCNQGSTLDFEILDQLLGISSANTFFLDQIFGLDDHSTGRASQMPILNEPSQTLDSSRDAMGDEVPRGDDSDPNQLSSPSEAQCINPVLFEDALHAYFDIAASSLPILFEDSFWEDYRSGRCSRALPIAIACRGVPFIQTNLDNWDLQQRLARQFQDAIFETHSGPNSEESVRLDDLEALALMVDFSYDDKYGLPFQSHLSKLFLGHDSLVLMILQSEIKCYHVSLPSSEPLMFARANERRTLLFWHVYGLDAFHTLDCKVASRIQEDDTEPAESLSPSRAEGYLDALLSLAVVARKIVHSLCSSSTRRLGVKVKDLDMIYAELKTWRTLCAAHLQVRPGDESNFVSTTSDQCSNLHRAVLRLLELNCYLQIDDCLSRFGVRDQHTLDGEIAALRVESETLRAAHEVIETAQWVKQSTITGTSGTSYSLIDAAPQILRNICAGTCYWMCLRGQGPPRLQSPHMKYEKEIEGNGKTSSANSRHLQIHLDAANTLREAVAAARSHQDTGGRLAQLDSQIELVQRHVDEIS